MTNLERVQRIDRAALSGKTYAASLIAQGLACGALSAAEGARIQADSLALLAERIEQYNRGESSSIRVERAQEILESIFYTVGVALKAYPSPEDALEALRQNPLAILYQAGQRRVERKISVSRLLHRQIVAHLFQTKNVFYRATVVDGIRGFFQLYDPAFAAQETHITLDYPTCNGGSDLTGIEMIERYLQNIAHENRFCRYFPAQTVHRLLCGVDEHYRQIVLNVYELVLTAALGCALTGRAVRSLNADLDELNARFAGRSEAEATRILNGALDHLIEEYACPPGLTTYMRDSAPRIARAVSRAVQLGHLETVCPIPFDPDDRPRSTLSLGERMDDRDYARMLRTVAACDDAEARADLVCGGVHALGDLLEVLRDTDWTRAQLLALLQKLPVAIVAALQNQYPCEDFLSDERERMLCAALRTFCDALPPEARAQVEQSAEALRAGEAYR